MRIIGICTIAAASLLAGVHAKRVEYNWDVSYMQASPDGFERTILAVNGQWPQPKIEVEKNDIVLVNVRNRVPDQVVNFHLHGLRQKGTPFQDGAFGVTECGIPPGDSRTYEYHIDEQVGTYWIHSHVPGQYMDGLRSPFIIHDPGCPYTYDEEQIITVSDWYHQDSRVNLKLYLSKNNPFGDEPLPQSGLINDQLNASVKFEPAKTYRFRLINMSGYVTFYFSIDGHELEIIEVDGHYTEPYKTKSLYLTAAQRVSVLVKAKETTDTNYLIHADMDTRQFDGPLNGLNPNITARLIYNESHNNFAPSEDIGARSDFNEISLRSLSNLKAVEPDMMLNLTIEDKKANDGLHHGMINRIPFIPGPTPHLFTELTMGKLASNPKVYGPQGNAYIVKYLDVVEIVLNNYDGDDHPFHLHGHGFQVVALRANSHYLGDPSTVDWVLDKPVIRDTVRVPGKGYAILRYKADNPGSWIFHCHNEWHLASGMAAVFIEAPEVAQETIRIDPVVAEQCRKLGHTTSGNAAGREGLDLRGAPSGVFLPVNESLGADDTL